VSYNVHTRKTFPTTIPFPPKSKLSTDTSNMSIPAFSDLAKASNDLLTKDFYHVSSTAIEVKSNAPNNVAFKTSGKASHEGATSGLVEAKYTDKPSGVTVTTSWNTVNAIDSKIEFTDAFTKGFKAEALGSFLPSTQAKSVKANLHFKQANFHGRAFFDLLKGPIASVDAVIGQDGFLVGASGGYDVQKAALTSYSAAIGYTQPQYTATITAANNLTIFSAAYYHKVNSQVEAGAKATWDSKGSNNVGLEVASKYRLDPISFAKAKINDRGVAAVSYNVLFRPGVTLGFGLSFDTQKLDQATHKVGTSFTFEG